MKTAATLRGARLAEEVEICQPFLGVEVFCIRCRESRLAPWLPAKCRCGQILRVAA